MRKSFPSILLVSLLSLGAATPALASGDAVLMSSGPSCGSFCADVSWIGESALMVIRGERGEIVKVESVDLPRDARLVSSTTTNSEQSEL
ncbi:MAG: hypothetical protein HYV16_10430, partial [Gammaproteobacteria bacterium]|nr:hypothetical protein [Gammaproteobacteria bacterium]